jgi:RHS repeat-associated protein
MQMQLASSHAFPEPLLAAMPQLREKPHLGLSSKNPALHQVHEVCNSTTALGFRAALHLERIRSRYTGKERDTESGNDYFGARYYASSMGRWLSPDWSGAQVPVPYANLSDPQSLNLYAYVRNNPLFLTDPDGHGWWGDFWKGLSNATWRPLVTMVEHPIITGKAIGNSVAHPIATYHALKSGVVTTTQQVMTGNGEAIGVAVGTVGMALIPGAGEAGEAAEGASDLAKIGELGEAAGDSGSLLDLNKSLASQEQMGQLAAGEGTPIAGAGTGTALRDADRLAAQYGGEAGDWQKVASGNYNPGGAKGGGFETHAYQNSKTGQVVEMKSKMQ